MNESESYQPQQPEVSKHDEATIRDIMDKHGIGFSDARAMWEIQKADANLKVYEAKEK